MTAIRLYRQYVAHTSLFRFVMDKRPISRDLRTQPCNLLYNEGMSSLRNMCMRIFNRDPQEKSSTNELQRDSARLRNQNVKLIVTTIMTLGSLFGCIVFGAMAYQMAEHEYSFSTYGTDARATITGCEMVAGRSGPHPLIEYRYGVDGETYSNTWLAQFEYDDCADVQMGNVVSVIYLRNAPEVSIFGEMSERTGMGYGIALFMGIGSIAFGLTSIASARRLFQVYKR